MAILAFYGKGKGKTSASIGSLIRGMGCFIKVGIIFFDKGQNKDLYYNEKKVLEFLSQFYKDSKLDVFYCGKSRLDRNKFRLKNNIYDKKEAEKGLDKFKYMLENKYQFIVLDEILNCLNLKLIKKESFLDVWRLRNKTNHIILTGRKIPRFLIQDIDLISKIDDKKHYFYNNQEAIEGIDY